RGAASGRLDDHRRDRARDDREVVAPSQRQRQQGGRVAGIEPRGTLPPLREVRDHGVSLRGRAIAYLVTLHVLFAAVAVYLFLDNAFWLIAIEVVFTASLVVGLRLSREMYRHLALTPEGLRLIREHEFTSRFLPVGQHEIDELIGIYNTMVDHLRAERVRVAEQH